MRLTKRCEGCHCAKCRWREAGSNCYYNEHGTESSRCSYCQVYARGEELAVMKTESYLCRGYQRKYEERLPKEKQRVIVRCEHVGTSVGWILWGNWMADIGPDAGKVTHWMPLPAPPDCRPPEGEA